MFAVGDLVQVRAYEDMVREFGLDEDNDIWCGCEYFTEDMRCFCHKVYRIIEIYGGSIYLDSTSGTDVDEIREYTFAEGMLQYPDEELPSIDYTFDAMFDGEE